MNLFKKSNPNFELDKDIRYWIVSNVTNTKNMFPDTLKFTFENNENMKLVKYTPIFKFDNQNNFPHNNYKFHKSPH